jgi:hypothetical protein
LGSAGSPLPQGLFLPATIGPAYGSPATAVNRFGDACVVVDAREAIAENVAGIVENVMRQHVKITSKRRPRSREGRSIGAHSVRMAVIGFSHSMRLANPGFAPSDGTSLWRPTPSIYQFPLAEAEWEYAARSDSTSAS